MDERSDEKREKGMEESEYLRRCLQAEDTDEAFSLLDQEDWNLTLAKFKSLHKVFPCSTFVTIKKATREVVAMVSVIPTYPGQYIIGNLIVRNDHQLRGLGKAMIMYVVENMQDQVGTLRFTLTAVPGTTQFYTKLGFQDEGPSHYVNYVIVDRENVREACSNHSIEDVVITKFAPDMFDALNNFDTESRGYDCSAYLSVMTESSDTFLLATCKSSGRVVGYVAGVYQPTLLLVDGLYADTDGIALHLYSALLDIYPEKQEIKIQEIKPRDYLSKFGNLLPKSHQYTRMALGGQALPPQTAKLYVVCDCDYSE